MGEAAAVFQVRETSWACVRMSTVGRKEMMVSSSSGISNTFVEAGTDAAGGVDMVGGVDVVRGIDIVGGVIMIDSTLDRKYPVEIGRRSEKRRLLQPYDRSWSLCLHDCEFAVLWGVW
jgi:hypothetical protein